MNYQEFLEQFRQHPGYTEQLENSNDTVDALRLAIHGAYERNAVWKDLFAMHDNKKPTEDYFKKEDEDLFKI